MTTEPSLANDPKERTLIEKSEIALRTALPLRAWFSERWRAGGLRFFELDVRPDATMHGFFDKCSLEGVESEVMGCVQSLRFHPRPGTGSGSGSLAAFINGRFFREATWTHEDGLPGGFGYTALIGRIKADGSCRRLPEPAAEPFPRLDQVGERYDWVLLQVDIHDFIRSSPLKKHARTLSRVIKEAAYLVMNPAFLSGSFPPLDGVLESIELGYAFVPATVHPNIFGYGPGRFGAAIKLFRFAQLQDGVVEIGMAFLSAPRSERIFYFGGVDPVYPLVGLADLLTFRALGWKRKFHDKMDTTFLRQHGLVHLNAMQGMRAKWENHAW